MTQPIPNPLASNQYSHPSVLPAAPPSDFDHSPRTHGPSLRCTQLWPSLLLPLSRHRQTRDPRPRRRRNIRLFAIHERRGFGTGEVTGKHCHRHKRRRVCCWCLLRQEVWGFDHSLERLRGAHEIGKAALLTCFTQSKSSQLARSAFPAHSCCSPHPAVTNRRVKIQLRVLFGYGLRHVLNPTSTSFHDPTFVPMSANGSTLQGI